MRTVRVRRRRHAGQRLDAQGGVPNHGHPPHGPRVCGRVGG